MVSTPKSPVGFKSGDIIMSHGLIANIRAGFVLCDGNNGTPDMRSKFVRGAPAASEAGGTGGSDTHTLSVNEMPSHAHAQSEWSGSGTGFRGGTSIVAYANTNPDTESVGGDGAHNNMPAYYEILFIMKT